MVSIAIKWTPNDKPIKNEISNNHLSPLSFSKSLSHLNPAQKVEERKSIANAYTSVSTALNQKLSEKVNANAYDLVLNGNEIGGGSIRIHDKKIQSLIFDLLGFSESEAKQQFGFLMNAFEYGAPPHGGIALGLDRLVAILDGEETIRDFIAFPKNNNGRDVMIDAPSALNETQLEELSLKKLPNTK